MPEAKNPDKAKETERWVWTPTMVRVILPPKIGNPVPKPPPR